MGSAFPHAPPPGISLPFPPCFPLHPRAVCMVWNTRPLWTTRSFHRLYSCASRRAFDTSSTLCTAPFQPAVGSVGNHPPLSPLTAPFSKSPDLHNPVLENSPPSQPPAPQPFRPDSHFSSPPTGTAAFVFILFTQNHPLRRSSPPRLHHPISACPSASRSRPQPRQSPESREVPLFSTPTAFLGCIQSREEKTVTSAWLFGCCRVRPARVRGLRGDAGPCQQLKPSRRNRSRRGQEW